MNRHTEEHQIVIQSLTDALYQLADEKPFSEITIQELIEKAGVARSTYYRNFNSKEEIFMNHFNQLINRFLQEHPVSSINEVYTKQYIASVLDFIIPYKRHIRILNKTGMSIFFLNRLNDYLLNLKTTHQLSNEEIFKLYSIAGAEYNLIFNWFTNDPLADVEVIKQYILEHSESNLQ